MTFRQALQARTQQYYPGDLRASYKNNQDPRVSGQGFTADPCKEFLTYNEFIESYFGSSRLDVPYDALNNDDDFELMHMSEVLADNII